MPGAREVLANSSWCHGQGRARGMCIGAFLFPKNWTIWKAIDEAISKVSLVYCRLMNITDLD